MRGPLFWIVERWVGGLSMKLSNQVGFFGPAAWANHEAGSSNLGRAERKLEG